MNKNIIISGIRWTLITTIIRRIITLVLFYFIAKWLSKEDFGIFREYSVMISIFSLISFLSLDFLYIIEQKKNITGLYALWQITITASVIGFLLLSFGSGIIGFVYKSEILGKLFSYTSIVFVIEILRRTIRSIATKKLQFKELAIAETLNVIFYSLVSIGALYFFRSLWVFLIIFYLGNTIELLYLWIINKSCIHLILGKLYQVGKRQLLIKTLCKNRIFLTQATLVSIVNQITSNAPILILGLYVNPVLIGLYFFASQLIGVPVGLLTNAIYQVFFPVFAGKKDGNISALSNRYIRMVGLLGLPLLLAFSYLVIVLVDIVFAGKWNDAIPLIMPIFVIYGSSLYCTPLSGIPFIKRKPDWELIWNIGSMVLKVSAMMIGLSFSFEMAIWFFAITSAVSHLVFYVIAMVLVQQRSVEMTIKVLLSLIPACMLGVVLIWVSYLNIWYAITTIILSCLAIMLLGNLYSKGKLISDIRILICYSKDKE